MSGKANEEIRAEIRRLERELFLVKSRLAVAEGTGIVRADLLGEGMNANEWTRVFTEVMEMIRLHSQGGSSVVDVRAERDA